MAIQDRLKKRRAELGMTLEEVARITGVTRATIQKYENGIISNIPADKIELLSKALKTTPTFLMGWDDPTKNPAPTQTYNTVTDDDIKFALFGGDGQITDEQYEEVKRFAAYVKERDKNK